MRDLSPDQPADSSDAVVQAVELESNAIDRTRRDTVRNVSLVVVVTTALGSTIGVERSGRLVLCAVLVLVGVAWAVAGYLLPRRSCSTWLSLAGLVAVAVGAALNPDPTRRADASTVAFVITYFGIVLYSRRAGVLWVLGGAAGLVAVLWRTELPVTVGGTELNARWFVLGQLVVSAAWLWRVWPREMDRARQRDARMVEFERDRVEAIRLQERVRVARETLVHTHETILNDLRYAITTDNPDRRRLAEQLAARRAAITPMPRRATVASVVNTLATEERLAFRLTADGDDVELDRRQAGAIAAVLRESIRNAQRYGGATTFSVSTSGADGRITLRFRHDGAPSPTQMSAGIGRAIVIDESLAAIGGSAEPHPQGLDIKLPDAQSSPADDYLETADLGRVALSVVPAGNAIGGIPFVVLLALADGAASSVVAAVVVGVAVILGAFATARRRLSPVGTTAIAIAAAFVPLAASVANVRCDWADVALIVGTLTGYSLSAGMVWSPSRRWWWLGLGWVGTMVLLYVSLPDDCAGTTPATLRAAALPIAFVALVYWSQRRTLRLARRAQVLRRRQAAEVAAADAALEVSRELQDTVAEATALMTAVAEGAPLDETTRTRLRCIDAAIRSTIQVDPVAAGGLTRAARDIVGTATTAGVPLRVLALRDSGNHEPLHPDIASALGALARASTEGTAVIQVLSAPGQDVLILTTTPEAASRARLSADWQVRRGNDDAILERSDDSAVAVALVTRSLPDEVRHG